MVRILPTVASKHNDDSQCTCRDIRDEDGPQIARWFYEELFSKDTLELEDIPRALETATGKLRESGASLIRWAAFVHMGT
jgi:hypothetical protein